MSTQPTDAMIEAGGLEFGSRHANCCYPQAMDFEANLAAEAIYLAMQSARTPPPCAGDDAVDNLIFAARNAEHQVHFGTKGSQREADNELELARATALGTTPSIVGQEKLDG